MQIARMQKEFVKVLNNNFSWISWFICSKQYIIVSWCIWELSKYESWNIWAQTCSFSYFTRISITSSLKIDQSKIRSLNWYQYYSWYYICYIIEKVSEEEYVTLFIDIPKLVTNTWKIMIKNRDSSYLKYWDVINLYNLHGLAMSQKLRVNGFKMVENASQFDGDFIIAIMKKVMKDIFLKLMFNILKSYMTFRMI